MNICLDANNKVSIEEKGHLPSYGKSLLVDPIKKRIGAPYGPSYCKSVQTDFQKLDDKKEEINFSLKRNRRSRVDIAMSRSSPHVLKRDESGNAAFIAQVALSQVKFMTSTADDVASPCNAKEITVDFSSRKGSPRNLSAQKLSALEESLGISGIKRPPLDGRVVAVPSAPIPIPTRHNRGNFGAPAVNFSSRSQNINALEPRCGNSWYNSGHRLSTPLDNKRVIDRSNLSLRKTQQNARMGIEISVDFSKVHRKHRRLSNERHRFRIEVETENSSTVSRCQLTHFLARANQRQRQLSPIHLAYDDSVHQMTCSTADSSTTTKLSVPSKHTHINRPFSQARNNGSVELLPRKTRHFQSSLVYIPSDGSFRSTKSIGSSDKIKSERRRRSKKCQKNPMRH